MESVKSLIYPQAEATLFKGSLESPHFIPYGETRSYKDIAIAVESVDSGAVGNANNKNPISFIIPCHRVIETNGKLGGYGGGLDLKQRLLDLEQGKPFAE